MKKYLVKILWGMVIVVAIVSCGSSDEILDENADYTLTEEGIAETLKNVNTEWGTSKKSVLDYMSGYQLIENSDQSVLQFSAKKSPITVAYQLSPSDKLCAALVMMRKDDNFDMDKLLDGFVYIGESSNKNIYSNNAKNVLLVAYETVEDEDNYQIIGFTPLYSMTEKVDGRDCVDLDLSVKWATCNIEANNPEDGGGYYAWGETAEKDSYTWNTYKYYAGSGSTCEDIGSHISGTQYDVVHTAWGGSWVMPTEKEMNELRTKCDWVWTKENGIAGYKVFGSNGNHIFLPAAGFKTTAKKDSGTKGMYMTDTNMSRISSNSSNSVLEFTSSKKLSTSNTKYYGQSVRAVVR